MINFFNFTIGVLSILAAIAIVVTLYKDKEGKTPLFTLAMLLICVGDMITGAHRISEILNLKSDDILYRLLTNVYPINDIILIVCSFVFSYIAYKHKIGDSEYDSIIEEEKKEKA